jgi:hypothetical protein
VPCGRRHSHDDTAATAKSKRESKGERNLEKMRDSGMSVNAPLAPSSLQPSTTQPPSRDANASRTGPTLASKQHTAEGHNRAVPPQKQGGREARKTLSSVRRRISGPPKKAEVGVSVSRLSFLVPCFAAHGCVGPGRRARLCSHADQSDSRRKVCRCWRELKRRCAPRHQPRDPRATGGREWVFEAACLNTVATHRQPAVRLAG